MPMPLEVRAACNPVPSAISASTTPAIFMSSPDALPRLLLAPQIMTLSNRVDPGAQEAPGIIIPEFYDAAVSGADPVDSRPGFVALLAYCTEHGVTTVLVENASRNSPPGCAQAGEDVRSPWRRRAGPDRRDGWTAAGSAWLGDGRTCSGSRHGKGGFGQFLMATIG
jgi:hypothetical protein